jgi:hypothetical protein
MCYIEQTGVKGYEQPIYAIKELNTIQLKMIKEGISMVMNTLVAAEDVDRHKLLAEAVKLNNAFV